MMACNGLETKFQIVGHIQEPYSWYRSKPYVCNSSVSFGPAKIVAEKTSCGAFAASGFDGTSTNRVINRHETSVNFGCFGSFSPTASQRVPATWASSVGLIATAK